MSSRQKPSSSRAAKPFNLKKSGGVALILAILILLANAVLSRQNRPLPDELVNPAETTVSEALSGNTPEAPTAEPAIQRTPTRTKATPATGPVELAWAAPEGDFDYYVLALSWQPAFCETKPGKPECKTQTEDRYDASNFVLHGLWPNKTREESPAYCGVPAKQIRQDQNSDWCALPAPELSPAVETDLARLMPGAASCLHAHEWYKHGVCAGMSADDYFALSNRLAALFAQTDFNRYIAQQTGAQVFRRDLLARFDTEFGEGSSSYLSLRCDKISGQSVLTELQIVLKKEMADVSDFSRLFPTQKVNPQGDCPQHFMIDPVGLGSF